MYSLYSTTTPAASQILAQPVETKDPNHWSSTPLRINYHVNLLEGLVCNVFQLKWRFGTHGNWKKIKILGAVLELPAKQHCQSSPFTSKIGPNGLNWQCCLAGSSKTAPRILIFFNCYGSIVIWAPAFFMHNNSFIATVLSIC